MSGISREIEAVTRELRRRRRVARRVATAAEAIRSATERGTLSRVGEKASMNGDQETFGVLGAKPVEAAPGTGEFDEEALSTWASDGGA